MNQISGGTHTASESSPLSRGRLFALLAGPLVSFALLAIPAPEDMNPEAWRLVAILAWMVIWWLGEAIAIPATALLPLVLMPFYGVEEFGEVAPSYAHPLIFLFLGGFMLAAAMQRVHLHRRVALVIISRMGSQPSRIILGFMAASAFLSMWMNNVSTTIMMYAVGISVVEYVSRKTADETMVRNFGVALLLSIAYSASIGGIGTLVGSVPNAMLASFLSSNYGIEVDFFTWLAIGLPVVLIMLPCTWLLLTQVLFPAHKIKIDDPQGVIVQELKSLGRMSRGEKMVAAVFLAAALGWILRRPLVSATGLPITDSAIAILAALVLFAVPVSRERNEFALDWSATAELPWGVLLLFGGGLAIAREFGQTGLAEWIGAGVADLRINMLILIALVSAAIVYLTEITSNTASTATFLPIMAAIGVGLGLDPMALTIPIAIGASMAFMMPVATPPNAIVFAYEKMTLKDMVMAGFWLNIIGILVCFGVVALIARPILGF